MLNPIKTPTQMMFEQAGLPHLGGGGVPGAALTGLARSQALKQFETGIKNAISNYRRATGKNPTADEVKSLEDHFLAGKNPALAGVPETPVRQPTMARLAAQEPNANKFVDEFGRAYSGMIDPKTGQLTTPERAQGFSVGNQFEVNPQTRKARKKLYDPKPDVVARPDEFVQMANVGRTSNRTNLRSVVPSTEELIAMQHAAEGADDVAGGLSKVSGETYGLAEGPRSASAPFAETAGPIENAQVGDLREQLVMALNPQAGEKTSRPLKAEIERARQSFLARGIEPDQEDIINAVLADRNVAQHNYLGVNPIGERPMMDPKAGKVTQEYLDWQAQMRAAGAPERVWGRNPADWDAMHKRDYLLDTTADTRQPFAQGWDLESLTDKRTVKKAAGGFIPSPRDMQAQLMVHGYADGGRTQPTPQQLEDLFSAGPQFNTMADRAAYMGAMERQPRMEEYKPSPSERLAATGQDFLERVGIRRPIARRASQTAFGGASSAIPGGFGAMDVAAMTTAPGALAYGPISAANIGHYIGKGEYPSAALESLNMLPFGGMAKRALTR
jgi:hypothetical protein